jgi:hypothetical protein
MPLITVPLDVFNQYREQYLDPPPEYAVFMKSLQTSTYARKPLTHQMSQNRGTNQPPQVRTVILELFNRMTTDNVPRIVDTINKLKLATVADLTVLVDFIFKFATSKQDARMSRAYAELVRGLIDIQVDGKKLVVQLLNKCQTEFKREVESELVEHKELHVAGDDGDAEGISRAFKNGLVQFIAALSVTEVLRHDIFDKSLAMMLAACCNAENTNDSKNPAVDVRVECAARMANIVADRYKRNKAADKRSEIVDSNIDLFRKISAGKFSYIGTKARFAADDFTEML